MKNAPDAVGPLEDLFRPSDEVFSNLNDIKDLQTVNTASMVGTMSLKECFGPEKRCLFADVLRGIDVGVIIVEPAQQSIEFCNPVALNILGISPEAISYQSLAKLLHPPQNKQAFGVLAYTSQSVRYGNQMLGYSTYPVAKTHLCLLIRDITEKARLESIAQAVNTMDNIGMIFSGIRHEMGNPLNSIKMTISVLEKNLDYFSRETIAKYIERISGEVARMEYMLKSLKNFSMFEKLESKTCDLTEFIENFKNLVFQDLEQKNIELVFEPAPPKRFANIDSRALNQALLNILANAVDSLEGRASPKISIASRVKEKFVFLEIRDNGCGMSEEQQKFLFRPFYTNKSQGNGLGLVITQKLLAKMNASISVRSAQGVGTKVEIVFPLTAAPPAKPVTKFYKEPAISLGEVQ